MCTRNALPGVIEEFAAKDPWHMAELSGAEFENNIFTLSYCNLPIEIVYPDGEVKFQKDGDENFKCLELINDEKVLILHYLSHSSGLPLRGQWISFLDLTGGQMHRTSFQKEVLEPLSQKYGSNIGKFIEKGIVHGGETYPGGAAGLVIPVFPKISIAFLLWEGEDEFPPRAQILFDSVAAAYFSTATLFLLAKQALARVWLTNELRLDYNAEEV